MKLNFRRLLAMFLSIVMVAGMLPAAVFAEDAVVETTPNEGYMLTIYNADGTVGMEIDGSKSVSDFSLKSAIEDARTFVDNAFLFGITTPATFVVEMYEDSTEDESFEIGSDVTVNGNGYDIKAIADISISGAAKLNDTGIDAIEGCGSLTVSGLTFAGNSWINSGAANKLTVSGVTANVTPSNTTYTNSRSAFISLGRSEQKQLELVVENSNIVAKGGADPILGWAAITKATITGNTFGSADAYQTNSDSVKFMAIAAGAVLNVTGNTVYSNYNGIVFGQNTTRDNAYTVNIDNNRFYGNADHIWVEISGGDTCHATIKATSQNTVNGEAFTANDIKAHTNVIKKWSSYMGVDVKTDADGKVIGGQLAFAADDAVADGYELDEKGNVIQSAPAAPTGSNSYAYTTEVGGNVRVWGEGGGNAKESFVLKLYSKDTLIATTTLNDVDGIIDGDVHVTWHFFYPVSTDEYWTTTWEEGHPNSAAQPTEVKLYIDGTCVATTAAKMSGADGVNPVVWAALGGVKKIVTGLSGEGTAEAPYLINNLEDLIWFRDTVDNVQSDRSNQFLGKYVKLTADIDLAGINWNPIGEKKDHGSFMGIFDGGDHTISNLSVEQAGECLGLFAYTGSFSESEQAVIKNLTLRNVTVKSTNNSNYVGGLVGNATTTNFENIHVTGTVEISGCGYIGGIVGHGYSDFDNVSVKATNGTISSTFWCAGGVIGYLGEGSTIKNAVVEDLTIKSAAGGLGSIVGMAEDNNGTQPCTGENLSAKNVAIQTYTGVYGDGYAENGLGYLIGGDTSVMTGSNTVENVTFACSNGTTNPDVSDAVASVNGTIYFDLQTALDAAAAGTGNITVEILRDVNLNGVDWNPVTVSANGYPVVTVNGNNKTITGLNDMLFAGTWAGKSGLIINDLTIKDSNIVNDADDAAGTVGVGAFIGFPQASETITLINCHLVNSIVKGGHWTGGLIGYAAGYAGNDGPVFMNLTIKDCSVTGSTITGKGSAGGVIGHGSGNGWTKVVIENTTVSGNNITSTGSYTNKAGSVMGTIGAAGQPTTVNGVTLTGGAFVSATVSGNTVTSAGTTITTIYGRQGTVGGTLEVTGGSYDKYPIEENVSYAAPAEGYVIEESADGTYGLVIAPTSKTYNVSTKADLDAAIAAAAAGDTILLTADIDYGTDQLKLEKAITLDLGGKTLTTRNAWGGMSVKNNPTIKNGTIVHASNTAAIKVWNATAFEDLVIDVQGKGDANKTIGGIVLQEGSTTHVGSIKNVTIKGVALTNGIETYNCGNATEPVIGSMENVTIDAKSVGLNISAPCGTATNCSIKGGINGIEIWIKGTYSATLNLVNCNVVGGVFAHDEFSSNPSIVNNGTLKLTADTATTGASEDAITLTIARAEKVEGILKNVMDNAQAKVNDTYYATLASAIAAAQNGDIITLIWAEGDAPIAMNGAVYGKTVTITGTATVDWSKGNLFVGRGGTGNGTVIFDNANLTSASDSSSYGIHVSGREKDTDNKYDGTLIIKDSTIELDYLINRNNIEVDNSTFTVKNGFGIAGRPASETESGTAATATIDIKNGSTVKVLNHNGMGVGRAATVVEGYGILNLTDSTFECASFNVDSDQGTFNVYGVSTVKINKLTGKTIRFQDGAIVKDSTVGGGVFVAGKVTFRGDNTFGMLSDFGTLRDYYGTTADMEWSVEAGASVTLTDKARYGLGYGDKVTIFGSLNDALKARDTLGESDIAVFMHGLVAQESTGWNKSSSLTVKDAYVVLGSNNSFGNKPGNYGGTYTFAFDNVVLDSSRITFYEAGSTTEFTFNNSDVKVGTFMIRDADSVFTLTDTKLVSTTTSNGNDEGNYLAGTLVLNNSSLSYEAPLEMEDGTLTLGAGSSLTADSIIGTGKIIIDATGMTAGKVTTIDANASGFTGTLKVINNDKLTATIDGNGDIVLVEVKTYVAKIGEEKFETVAAALAYAKEQGMTDVEITLIGETESNTTDSFDLQYTALFNSVTIKQEDPTKTYYLYDLYTGVRTNGDKFIFDGVNITVTDQYMFQGNVELINNSKITSTADANCFFYYADVIVNGGSSIKGVIEDIRGGTLTIDGGKTDGTYAETPSLQDAIFIVNWVDSNLVLQNGAYVKINAANEVGRLTVNGTLNISDSKLDSYQWIAVNAGATLTVNGNSTITTKEITGAGKLVIDATNMTAGAVATIDANASAFTGTLEVINNEKLTAEIDDNGNIVLVAKVVEATIKAESATLLYEDMIQIRYKFSVVGEDIAEYGMLLFSSETDAGAHDVTKAIQQKALIKESDGFYYGYTDGIAAKEMGDSQFVVGYVKLNDGSYVYGNPVEYSPKIYAQRMVNKDTSSAETKALCNALMNYGAAAQLYFEYKTDFLMNDGFASVNYDETVLGTSIFSVNTTVTNGFTTKSATLLFEGALTYRVKYAASNEISDKSLYLEYTVKGATNSVQMMLETDGYYYGYIAGIAAKDMDEALNAKPYYLDDTGNRVYGAELVYSGYEYARRTIANSSDANSVNLAKAFAMYISAANAAISK